MRNCHEIVSKIPATFIVEMKKKWNYGTMIPEIIMEYLSIDLHCKRIIKWNSLEKVLKMTIQKDVRCYLWVLISLMTSDAEHFFMYLLEFHISSLKKCLIKSFAHFCFVKTQNLLFFWHHLKGIKQRKNTFVYSFLLRTD